MYNLSPEEVNSIYRNNSVFIQKTIQFHLGHHQLEEDIFQAVFLRLLEKPIPKKEIVNQRAYLYRLVTNFIIDEFRRVNTYRNYVSKYSKIKSHKVQAEDFYKNIIQKDEIDFIMASLDDCLSPKIVRVLRMRYQRKYSLANIARVMFIKRKTVVKYTSIGLEKLRRFLNDN